jgi:RNA polymerase sigma factor (sigma-70 family)
MLGPEEGMPEAGSSVEDAEDLLQEAYLRWHQADADAVRSPEAWLVAVVSRLSIDRLRRAATERAAYAGTWLPEPIASGDLASAGHRAELASDLSMAFLVLLERLSPEERAAFLLRDVFGCDYGEMARVLERSEVACRQLVHRARTRVRQGESRFAVAPETKERLIERLLAALSAGDRDGLLELLAEDAALGQRRAGHRHRGRRAGLRHYGDRDRWRADRRLLPRPQPGQAPPRGRRSSGMIGCRFPGGAIDYPGSLIKLHVTPGGLMDPAAPRVVLIESELAVRRLLEQSLAGEGCVVTAAGDGVTGLDLIATGGACDVVLASATLPDLDAYDVCSVLRECLPATPVILICDPVHGLTAERTLFGNSSLFLTRRTDPALLLADVRASMAQALRIRRQLLEAQRGALSQEGDLLATGTDRVARARSLGGRHPSPPCPKCGSDRVIPIVYGAARMELLSAYATSRVALGGARKPANAPTWQCRECDNRWSP